MSGVSGISSSSTERLEMLLMQQAVRATSTTTAQSTGTTASGVAQNSASLTNLDGVESLQQQIQDAIAAALQSLDTSSSAEEIMDAIKNAVDRTLRANGIEPPAEPEESDRPSSEGSALPPGGPLPGNEAGNSMMSMIDSLLEQYGFDPEAIRSELQEAMAAQAASNGTSGSMMLILQLPTTGVDTQV